LTNPEKKKFQRSSGIQQNKTDPVLNTKSVWCIYAYT